MRNPGWWWLAALVSCSGGERGERVDERVAGGSQAYFSDLFVVANVVIDPATYHWDDPSLLLTTSEGAGPRTLNVSVSASVTPHVAYTGTRTPPRSEISTALGWDVSQSVQLTADSSVLVPLFAYARVAAYPAFQRATWDSVGPGRAVVGSGAAYKPIGVYFDTCGCLGPDPCGAACIPGYFDGAGPPAGAPDPPDAGADGG